MEKFIYQRLSPGNEVLVCKNCLGNGEGSPAFHLSLIRLAGRNVVFCPNCEAREEINFGKENEKRGVN
jgi:hypothetical protein